jgi:uncharacterized C2H2 Zn-finger protein
MLRTFSSLQFWFVLKQSASINFPDLKSIATKVSQLLSPCALGHGDMLRIRDEEGFLALQCPDCGQVKRVLQKPTIKGPQHHAAPVKGAPLTSVKRVPPERKYPRSA